MASLAVALVRQGHEVTYAAERMMSEVRARQGWQAPPMEGVHLRIVPDVNSVKTAAAQATTESVHICQGLRANGLVSVAQQALKQRGLRQWVVMEMVDDRGISGVIKRLVYRALFMHKRRHLQGALATGLRTAGWVVARGMPAEKVFPFAYFLSEATRLNQATASSDAPFRFLFVGQFIERKRLDLLIEALGHLVADGLGNFSLQVVGSGPLDEVLHGQGRLVLGDRLEWKGSLQMAHVRESMDSADCLVLPSEHDGWGAVVSEALMAGTPAICSDACGAAAVVRDSSVGGIFPAGQLRPLCEVLQTALRAGKVSPEQRDKVSSWARALGANAGAAYLSEIVSYSAGEGDRPEAPWTAAAHGRPF